VARGLGQAVVGRQEQAVVRSVGGARGGKETWAGQSKGCMNQNSSGEGGVTGRKGEEVASTDKNEEMWDEER